MLRHVLLLAAAAALVGCETSASIGPMGGGDKQDAAAQRTQLASFAAKPENHYPTTAQASDDLRAAAVINRNAGSMKIYNFTDESIDDAKVWVNGTHVYKVDSIPPKQSKTLTRAQFYDKNGMSLAASSTPVQRVQLQTGETLSNLQGPIFESGK